jgi:hypothetical protein
VLRGAWFSGQFVSENTAKTTGVCPKKRTGGGNLGYFDNIRILGFFPAARTTLPALYGSGALVGASPCLSREIFMILPHEI